MSKLLIAAPNASIYESAKAIVAKEQLKATVVHTSSDTIVSVVQSEFAHDSGIVVARGHQARLIRAQTSIPVVDITLSAMDMIILLHQARQLLKTDHPRIAFAGFHGMFCDCAPLSDILDVDPRIYYAATSQDMPGVVEQAARDGVELIIGGEMVCSRAAEIGLPSLFLYSMAESVRAAIHAGMRMLDALVHEQMRTAEISSLLDYSFNAILKLDSDGRIETCNYPAEKFLHAPLSNIAGSQFFKLPNMQITPLLEEALREHRSLYSTIIRLGGDSFVTNVASIDVGDHHDGYIVSMQEFGAIQELEETVRIGRQQEGYIAQTKFEDFRISSVVFRNLIRDARQYAQYDVPLLLDGPAGLPKFELAESIHNASLRKRNPFVVIDLSSIPLSSQYEYIFGSDTIPVEKGMISTAHTGTVYLPDVHLLTPESQHQLMNLLRHEHYYRKGAHCPSSISVRVICSTPKNLLEEPGYLQPLARQLSGITLTLPALRRLTDDLSRVIHRHFDAACVKYKKPLRLSEEALRLVIAYPWPGNVHELIAFCERAVILATGPVIDADFIREHLLRPSNDTDGPDTELPALVVADQTENELRAALREAGNNRQLAAEKLGISRSSLWRRMKKYGLE